MAVADPDPPVSTPPASAIVGMEHPPSTPKLSIASPTTSSDYELASRWANCQLLTPVKVRERPAVYSRLVDLLKHDTKVMVIGQVPGSHWYRVQTHGRQEGFVYGDLIPRLPENGDTAERSSFPTLGLLQLDEADAASTEITQLLALASEHGRADRLMAPRFDNALAVYKKILRVDPKNEGAQIGIETIKMKLMGFAHDAATRGDIETARSQINKVLLIDYKDKAARAALAKFGETVPLLDFVALEERAPKK